VIRRLLRWRAARSPATPWRDILADGVPAGVPRDGPTVLAATSVGGHPIAPILDSLIATALWLRGASPHFLLCDAALPACEQVQYANYPKPSAFVDQGPRPFCGACFGRGRAWLEPLPLPLHRYNELLAPGAAAETLARTRGWDVDTCFTFVERNLRLGEQARASTIRFFGKADLSSEPEDLVRAVAQRYAAGAIVASLAAERAIETLEPDVLIGHHGVYIPQGVLGEVARRDGVRVVNWGTSYRDRTAIFSHADTYHRTLLHEPESLWNQPLTQTQETELLEFLARRRQGEGDWRWVTPEAALRKEVQAQESLLERLAIDPSRPVIGLLTNVLWDAQLYYEGHAFADMLEWLWFTIDHFAGHPEQQLVVRIHPHEIKAGNRQPVGPEIARRYPTLPENVRVVPHDDPANTYALMDLCAAVLIYGTKTGVELAPFGTPVIVAADAWIRGKGLTYDVSTKDEYAVLLGRAGSLGRLDAETVERAQRYAYYFFFRRMIPLSSLEPDRPEVTIGIRDLGALLPGRDPGLDVICDGILTGSEFVFDG
jgi:hypothetical protein